MRKKEEKMGGKNERFKHFFPSQLFDHYVCIAFSFFLSRMFWQFPVPAVMSKKLMQHLCCWQTVGSFEPMKTAMYMYTLCWRTSHIEIMEMSPLARGQDLHKEEKHYSLNQELKNIPSWLLETIFTTDFFHFYSSILQLQLRLFHLHWAWAQLWFQFNRKFIYEAYLGCLGVKFIFFFFLMRKVSHCLCKGIFWSSAF